MFKNIFFIDYVIRWCKKYEKVELIDLELNNVIIE